MAKAFSDTVILMGDPLIKQRECAAAITPGHLIERDGSGTVVVHNSADANQGRLFAIENDIAGDDLEHAYATGEIVRFAAMRPGDEVNAILANGENASIGSYLTSNGNGELKVHVADSIGFFENERIVGVSLVDLDFSGSDAVDPASQRLRIEIV